jgi:hypothetical protein
VLPDFFYRLIDDTLNPFFLDHGAIWALMHRMEVLGEFHWQQFTRHYSFVKSRRPTPKRTTSGQNVSFQVEQNPNMAAMRCRVEPVVTQPAPPQTRT